MTDVVSLFGGNATQSGLRLTGPMARQSKRQQEGMALRAERAAIEEQARAFLMSQAMTNTSVLMTQARAQLQIHPGGADILEGMIRAHAAGSVSRISRF